MAPKLGGVTGGCTSGPEYIGDVQPGIQITPELMKDAGTAIKLDTLAPHIRACVRARYVNA